MRKRMHHIAFVAALLLLGIAGEAQQLPQFSIFQDNAYILNPALAGSNPFFEVRGTNRSQWSGIQDAPRTFSLSMQGPLRNPHMGVGGYLFTDNVGPTRRTGIQLSYSWHFFLNEDLRLALGLSGGALQFAIDGSKITLAEDGDPALFGELQSQTMFDASFGAFLYTDEYYIGFSAPQLLQNQVRLYDSVDQSGNRLEDHYYLMAGYRYQISDDWRAEPSLLIRYVHPAPLKWELGARAWWRNMVWGGISYRSNDAIIAMAGYEYRESLSIGYAYDITMSGLRQHTSGTHEIVLGFRFNQQ